MEGRFHKPIPAEARHVIQRNLDRSLLDQGPRCGEVCERDLSECSDGITKLPTVMGAVEGTVEGGYMIPGRPPLDTILQRLNSEISVDRS